MMTKIRQRLNQKGFTLVELMVVIAILGILAAIAIPKFGDATATANTAKIQADLRTMDAAIVMYQAQNGADPADLNALKTAGLIVEIPAVPKGNCFIGGASPVTGPGGYYYNSTLKRAVAGDSAAATNTSDKFFKKS